MGSKGLNILDGHVKTARPKNEYSVRLFFRDEGHVRISIHDSYVYAWVPVPGHRSKEMPLAWTHADLGSLRVFLKEEQKQGRFTPQTGLPF